MTDPLTDVELATIEARDCSAFDHENGVCDADIVALIAEVRRLREENARQHSILGTCQGCAHNIDNHWEDGCREPNCLCPRKAYHALVRF